jgi:hypothetical protein
MCNRHAAGTLGSSLQTGLANTINSQKQIDGVALLDFTVDGCDMVLAGAGRRLLSTTQDYMIVTQKVMVSSINGSAILSPQQILYLGDFFNTSTWTTILGGGGYISTVQMNFVDTGGNSVVAEIIVGVRNSTSRDVAVALINSSMTRDYSARDVMFVKEYVYAPSKSSASELVVVGLNLLVFMALATVCVMS